MFKKLKDKRGVSMAEMIIAMTIITLVTAAAMTIMISSLRTTNRDFSEAEDQNFTSNAVACFTAANSAGDFAKKLISIGYNLISGEDQLEATDQGVYVFDLENGHVGQFIVSFIPGNNASLNGGVYENADDLGSIVIPVVYQKGAR